MSDAVHRSTSGLVVIPLEDPKAFPIKKSSIFTYRPFTKGNEHSNELLCPIVDDTGSSSFDVKPFRLKLMLDHCVLHDGHSSFKTLAEFTGTSNRKPHGSVILSRGENLTAVGILHCRDDGSSRISPVSFSDETLTDLRPSGVSGKRARVQYTVQQQSGSSDPEIAREIPAEQPTQVGGRGRHEVLPANREGDLPTSTIQAQRNERSMSQVNLDQLQGILSMKINAESVTTRNPQDHSQRQEEFMEQVMRNFSNEYLEKYGRISTQDGLEAYVSFLSGMLIGLHTRQIKSSSLIFVVQCCTLDSLEKLWANYQSGYLNEVAESCLVTEKIRRKFDIESLTLKTTIDKEDYLACRSSLTKHLQDTKPHSAGLRVVCGPNWNVDESDGKEGFVGTVVELGEPENMALVQWDIGLCQLHRAGCDGAFDLCVLDSSSVGVKHVGLACFACKQSPILGTCWNCLDCKDQAVNLCTSCYMADEHDIQHVFHRRDSHGAEGVSVGRRRNERKIQARGIYPGAKVTRGPDWQYDNQDGGIGTFGTVKKITNWKENPASAAAVSWENGTESTYRLGYHGKVDLKCVTANSGGYYYKCHLPSLGQKNKTHDMSWKSRAANAKASRSALHKASISGQRRTVRNLLKNGEGVDQTDMFSLTPLHLAAWYGHESVVKMLLQHGADVNAVDRFQKTALQKAERHNHQSIVQLLLKNNATPSYQQPLSLKSLSRNAFLYVDRELGFNLLQAVVFEGKYDTVLIAHGLLVNVVKEMNFEKTGSNAKCFPVKTAVEILASVDKKRKEHIDIEKLYQHVVEVHNSLSELHLCARNDDAEKAVELVLNEDIDINIPAKCNRTPLLWASPSSSSQVIKTLVDLGADVNVQRTDDKVAPLRLAAYCNNYMATNMLLQYGADANIQVENGDAPLHYSARHGKFSVSKLLIESGSKVNMRNYNDKTPLYLAVESRHDHVIKLLLESHADVNMQYKQNPKEEKRYLVRGKDRGRPVWYYVIVEKSLLGLFLKRTNGGSLNVADFGTVLKSGWGENPPESTKKEICNEATALYNKVQGKTLLHRVCENNNIQLVELLVEHEADINCRDAEGFTPLHIAAIRGQIEVVKKLVELGADDNLTTLDGKDAAYLAELNEETEIEEFLKSNERRVGVMVGALQEIAKERKFITEASVDRATTQMSIPSGL